jgi:hypothetical protein
MSATLKSRIPAITQRASIRAQRAVEFAGQEIEFRARQKARKQSGDMAAGIEWKPGKGGMSGRVVGRDFKTRWHEYGTKRGLTAQPMLTPAAHEAEAAFVLEMAKTYR